MVKDIAFFDDFDIINAWQHFGNKKSISQNKMCNRSKKSGNFTMKLKQNNLSHKLNLPRSRHQFLHKLFYIYGR